MSLDSRAKGKAGERELARLFQAWWRQLEPGCVFASTPASGGWSTPAMRGEFLVAGDLCTTARRWPWTVECKRREGFSERELRAGRRSPVWSWWAQCCRAAAEEGREPLLCFRRSREPWRALVRRDLVVDQIVSGDDWPREPALAWPRAPAEPHPVGYALVDLLALEPARLLVPT